MRPLSQGENVKKGLIIVMLALSALSALSAGGQRKEVPAPGADARREESFAPGASGQRKESLALLPFTGVQIRDGESIVAEFTRQRVLRDAFNEVTLVTRATRKFMRFEREFQRYSGLTDADTVFELGRYLNAQYVIAGDIARFGNQNLVLVSILNVESLQLVAGDYRVYKNIEDVDALIPEMARRLAESVGRDTGGLPGLSAPPFELSDEVSESDAQVLAQILAINVANGDKYAVLPRTDSLRKVMEEHERQRSGETDQERVRRGLERGGTRGMCWSAR
jgi:TolB-like protein